MARSTQEVGRIVRRLLGLVEELERAHPGRKFTLDGHLVGSIGEVLAAEHYGLTLLPMSAPLHDAIKGRKRVQIKATQSKSIGIRAEPEHLLVLRLSRNGTFEEVYNGPGKPAWDAAGKKQNNGQRQIGVAKLRKLMDDVPRTRRLRPTTAR